MKYFQHRFDSVEKYLHHRPPYLLVEGIESIEDNEIRTFKKVSSDEWFLAGHFPGAPVFPGAMMQELVTQSAGVLLAANFNPMQSYDTTDPHYNEFALGVLIKVRSARYRGFARPGDCMQVQVRLNAETGGLFDFSGKIEVKGSEIMRIEFCLSNIASALLTESS